MSTAAPSAGRTELVEQLDAWITGHADLLEAHREHDPRSVEQTAENERELQRLLFEDGWTRWGWPEDCGGLGGDATNRAVLYDRMGAHGYVLPELLGVVETLGPMLIEFARPIAQAHLAALLRGDEMWCQGFSEPNAGSDLASLRCKATQDDDGFVVNGQKIWVSLGHVAQWCVLLARTGSQESAHRGISMFMVDMSLPGIEVRPIRYANGRNELSELFFSDVRLPPEALIGEAGAGWNVAMYLLQWERGMYAWQRQAWLHKRLDDLVVGLGSDAGAQADRLGDVYLDLASLRATCARTVAALARGESPGPEISVDKLLLGAGEQSVIDAAIELLDADMALSPEAAGWRSDYFYARAATIYGGAAEIQRGIIAQRVLGLPREVRSGR
ncbi:MAG: acdA 2 [Acidimicrobiales bacterium]|nr:acdA 2 [Acidimicrobiales bacterium]